MQHGGAPQAEQLRAQVALRQAQLQHGLLQVELQSSKQLLASLWGANQVDFHQVSGDLFQLAQSPSFQTLYQQVLATPSVEVFAARQRLRDAELAMAQRQRHRAAQCFAQCHQHLRSTMLAPCLPPL